MTALDDTSEGFTSLFSGRDRSVELAELANDVASAAYLRGDFVLSSGERSSFYFDKYLFETKPTILRRAVRFLAEMVPERVDRLAGPELGAVALAAALSLETGIPFVIVRKSAKTYGTSVLVEGELHRGERVLIIEDVVSTAAEALRAARTVERSGGVVSGIVAVIDREQGGAERISEAGYPYSALFRLRDFRITGS